MRLAARKERMHTAQPVQAAAVCYRRRQGGGTQLLLVRTSSGRWTFPKGRLERGLSHAQVAAIEAFEEGGVDGRVDPTPIGTYVHTKESLRGFDSNEVTVLAFLLEVTATSPPPETSRAPRWCSPAEAKRRLSKGRSACSFRSVAAIVNIAVRYINSPAAAYGAGANRSATLRARLAGF
jgi:8-oxo-dGTP pyrophosphatase MutT (NUDIX family)